VSGVIDEHRRYLRDRHRVSAYQRALTEVVSPNSIVVDLASGTGILGMLAARAGAARVYAIEETGIAGLARRIVHENRLDDVIVGVRGRSGSVALPEPADVVVCDQLGPFGVDGGILEVSRHARDRFLKPSGSLVPHAVELSLALIEDASLHERIRFWREQPGGLNFSAAAEIAANSPSRVRLRSDRLLSSVETATALDLTCETTLPVRLSTALRPARDGVLHGIGAWFTARLSRLVSMTNSPVDPQRIKRRQMFFPIHDGADVREGEPVTVSMQILPEAGVYSWDVEIAGNRRFQHSTMQGLLLTLDDVKRTDPAHRPERTPDANARLTVLSLCDGRHTLREIECRVFEAHRDLFGSSDEAAAFVARVLG
jgi:hypothetical protein